jgi:hypothetical protein
VATTIEYCGNKVRFPEPWERQAGEGSEAFEAFAIYRDAQPKIGAGKVGEKCGKKPSLTERWCTKYRWKERREAWEDEQDRLMREELIKGITAMRKNHTDIAKQMLIKALKALQQIPTEEMTMQDIARAVDVAAKLERISRGEATERTEGKTTIAGEVEVYQVDLSGLTDEELARLDEIAGKIAPS